MSDNLTASGGVCAPVSWAFDRNRGPDPVRVERMLSRRLASRCKVRLSREHM